MELRLKTSYNLYLWTVLVLGCMGIPHSLHQGVYHMTVSNQPFNSLPFGTELAARTTALGATKDGRAGKTGPRALTAEVQHCPGLSDYHKRSYLGATSFEIRNHFTHGAGFGVDSTLVPFPSTNHQKRWPSIAWRRRH